MTANRALTENTLLEAATAWLRDRFPESWTVEIRRDAESSGATKADTSIEIRGNGIYNTLAVEARRSLGPRDVGRLFGSIGRALRARSPHIAILVVAPWLSARTRDLLVAENVNYIDLTGNALVRLENPAVFIQTEGAARDPSPDPRAKPRLRGRKATRLIRTLMDVRPPYGVRALGDATGLAPGYVSRLLETLDEEALIERSKRGAVEAVDLAGLSRRWAEGYDVFRSNEAATFIAPRGAAQTLPILPPASQGAPTAITGSFAAVRHAPVAGPALLSVYCTSANELAKTLQLIPTDEGANVVLLSPLDPIVWERMEEDEGIHYVAPSQAVVDCLTGNGRMPAEGEALLDWMLANEGQWRLSSLAEAADGRAA